jgi:hypothetical protein
MATELNIAGANVKERHPWGVWALSLITLGIYGLVWWYKINREIRDYSAAKGQPIGNNPALSLLALFPFGVFVVPSIWTHITTPMRVKEAGRIAGGAGQLSVVLAVILLFILALNLPYTQGALNEIWRAETNRGD